MIKICEYCKKQFELKSKFHPKQRFCDRACMDKDYQEKHKLEKLEYNKKWRLENPEKRRLQDIRYEQSEKGKISCKKKISNYKNKCPERFVARMLVKTDKKKNPHLYPNKCSKCEETKNIEFHHTDYSKPLEVIPLCKKHHQEIHNNIKSNL